jgi:hypothetical protein
MLCLLKRYLYYSFWGVLVLLFYFGIVKTSNAFSVAVQGSNPSGSNVCISSSEVPYSAVWFYKLGRTVNDSYDNSGGGSSVFCETPIIFDLSTYATTSPTTFYLSITPNLIDYYYAIFVYNSGVISLIFDNSTHFDTFTYSTTTNIARVTGYWNATSTTGITEQLEFHQFSEMLGIESFKSVTATTTGLFDLSFLFLSLPTPATATTTAPFVADTTLFAKIYQYDNNYATDQFSGIFDSRYKTLLVATSTTISTLTGLYLGSTTDIFAYPEYECSISSITGCFKNALIWAFYPTKSGVEQYYSFINLIESKAPIGYFFVARNSIQGLNATSTSAVNIVIPSSLKQYIFTPFDVGIAGILWAFFLFNFYKRLKFITI